MANSIEARDRVIEAINEHKGQAGLPIKLKCFDLSSYGRVTRIADAWFNGQGIYTPRYPLIEASTFVATRLSRINGVDIATPEEWGTLGRSN